MGVVDEGWGWVLVDTGCKRALSNLFKIDGIKGCKIRFIRHDELN